MERPKIMGVGPDRKMGGKASLYIYFFCSLVVCMCHGSEATNWARGTPSSKSLLTTAEKSLKKRSWSSAYALAYFLNDLSLVRM
jgi:hypothetical protein